MKTKHLLAWLLVFAMCFMLVACVPDISDRNASAAENNGQTEEVHTPAPDHGEQPNTNTDGLQSGTATPLLYRVTDKSGNVAWLFGSIHVGREDYYPLPAYVREAFENADALAVELDIVAFEKDVGLQMKSLMPLVYQDGSTIKDHIPRELYDQAVDVLKDCKLYATALDLYCPALWGSLIESWMVMEMGGNADLGIDRHLLDMAYDTEKEIIEIESAEFQYKMLADFEDDVQIMFLKSAVQSYEEADETVAGLEKMMDLWAAGDESAFSEYLNASDDTMTEEEKQTYEKYNQVMITDRNLAMADYAEEALSGGKEIFICVGAAHIVGEGAVAELLSQRGYLVERIQD